MVAAYDGEVHKCLPEIFAQLAVLRLFDADLHARAYESISRLSTLDAQVGMALLKAETDNAAAIDEMSNVHEQSLLLYREIDFLFGGRLQLGGSEGQARTLVGKSSEVSGSGRGPLKDVDAAVWTSLQRVADVARHWSRWPRIASARTVAHIFEGLAWLFAGANSFGAPGELIRVRRCASWIRMAGEG
jgi:hypothetical protein